MTYPLSFDEDSKRAVACDKCHDSPCKELDNHITLERQMAEDVRELKETCRAMKEMLEAWNNTKGFVTTIKNVGKLLLWLVAIVAAFSAMSEVFRHWLQQR